MGGTHEIDTKDSTFTEGGVALAGDKPKFDNLKIGHDNNTDGDLADAGDDLMIDEGFGSTSVTFTYDNAGNLVDDGHLVFYYDAWNRLVKAASAADKDVTIHQAEYDGTGRGPLTRHWPHSGLDAKRRRASPAVPSQWRVKKTVTNSGQFDGTEVYYFDGWKIIEVGPLTRHQPRSGFDARRRRAKPAVTSQGRAASANVKEQFVHGTQYIDEIVMMRAKHRGDLYVHQDANWNVIALTDLGGSVVERYVYEPYGQVTVYQETAYGDRDADAPPLTRRCSAKRRDAQRLAGEARGDVSRGDVDAADKGSVGTTCTGTVSGACRILDLDFDGDYDNDDATLFDSLPPGLARHPGRPASGVAFPFAHQGLYLDPELGSYQNRARQYDPAKRRFMQRDPQTVKARCASEARDGVNIYVYLRSNPGRFRDPTGLACPIGNTVDIVTVTGTCKCFWTEYTRQCMHCPCGHTYVTYDTVVSCGDWPGPCTASPPAWGPACCAEGADPNYQNCMDCCLESAEGLVGDAHDMFLRNCYARCSALYPNGGFGG
ncbi:MAG TPA: RHS repeat-associated core domain-containing protein [Phycisphaerae bacterium]|nr:RHS repeat-associated core domain-containing protein [Phycisphaerae bacterium]